MSVGPDGALFLGVLVAAFVAVGVVVVRTRFGWVQLVGGGLAFVLAATFGVGLVNRFYHYYDSWSALVGAATDSGTVPLAAVSRSTTTTYIGATSTQRPPSATLGERKPLASKENGAGHPAGTVKAAASPAASAFELPPGGAYAGHGQVVRLELAGAASGITRKAFVYLPPQYADPRYASVRFPVVELLHGDPGDAAGWLYGIHLRQTMDALVNAGTVGPMVLVMPTTFTGSHGQECMNATAGLQDETYLATDVPADVRSDFRVTPPGATWAVAGLSEGGFCAANIALHHPDVFGAAGVMDGYFAPEHPTRTLEHVLGGSTAALQANEPSVQASTVAALPRFWVMAGTRDHTDYTAAQSFVSTLSARERPYFLTVEGGEHTTPAWRTALPSLLQWAWPTLTGAASPSGASTVPVGH